MAAQDSVQGVCDCVCVRACVCVWVGECVWVGGWVSGERMADVGVRTSQCRIV